MQSWMLEFFKHVKTVMFYFAAQGQVYRLPVYMNQGSCFAHFGIFF